jgi:hypothetical protein
MKEKENSELKSFLINPVTKATITGTLAALLTILSAYQFFKHTWLIIISVLVYISVIAIFARFETNYFSLCKSLELENKTYEDALRSINSICRTSAKMINEQIHDIQDTGTLDGNRWNFQIACDLVCEQILSSLNLLLKTGKQLPNITVGYVKLNEEKGTNDTIQLFSFCQNRNNKMPTILHKDRNIHSRFEYHDSELFQKQFDEPELLLTPEEVQDTFIYRKGTSRRKYKQFIGVPIYCDRDNGSKMVGLLEVVCLSKLYFPKDIETSKGYVDNLLLPYAYLLLILHKMEKALVAAPSFSLDDSKNET